MPPPSSILLQPFNPAQSTAFPWGELTWFASADLGNCSDLTVGRCLIKPGQSNPPHYHPNCSEVLVVIHGQIRHTIADGRVALMLPGDTVTVPPNTWHNAANAGSEDAILFIAFSSASRQTIGE